MHMALICNIACQARSRQDPGQPQANGRPLADGASDTHHVHEPHHATTPTRQPCPAPVRKRRRDEALPHRTHASRVPCGLPPAPRTSGHLTAACGGAAVGPAAVEALRGTLRERSGTLPCGPTGRGWPHAATRAPTGAGVGTGTGAQGAVVAHRKTVPKTRQAGVAARPTHVVPGGSSPPSTSPPAHICVPPAVLCYNN